MHKVGTTTFLAFLFSLWWAAAALAVTPPTISPGSGSYVTQQSITMSAPAGTIYYTLDGTTPSNTSSPYSAAITVTRPTQINAVAYQSGTYSSVTTVFVDVDPKLMPIVLPGTSQRPALRLRSDFGMTSGNSPLSVINWTDLSGDNVSVSNNTATAPLLAYPAPGVPVARFNGSSNLAIGQGRFSDSYTGATYFIVSRPSALTAGSRIIDFGRGSSGDDILLGINSSGSLGNYSVYNATTPSSATTASALTNGQFNLLEASQAATADPMGGYVGTAFLNGVAGTAVSMNKPRDSGQMGAFRTLNFLGQASSGGSGYSGDVAEVLIYYGLWPNVSQLTSSQQLAVEAYLLQKYQLLSQTPSTPVISVPGGTLLQPAQVVISTEPGTTTFYTTDGTTPSASSPIYSGEPLTINYSLTLKAIRIKAGVASSVATATYTLDANQWPAPNPSDTTTPSIQLVLPEASQ